MSVEWSAGYVTDVNYTFGYYSELNPHRAYLPLITSGYYPPTVATACELGFGQGLSVALHASVQPNIAWSGTDFNPAHACFAKSLVEAAGGSARLSDEAFAEFCGQSDLPDFDFIGLHGVWTWISDDNRRVLVDFLRRKLKVGGVLYISYNTNPGWAAVAPLRHLMKRHADIMGSQGQGPAVRIDESLAFIGRLFDTKPGYVQANPIVAERFKRLQTLDRSYIAHEYMNRDWEPMAFGDMETWLSSAKLSFVCSAHTLDHTAGINLTPDQITFLQTIADPSLRETVRDYCINQQFRRDYWVKGPRKMPAREQIAALRAQRLVLVTPRVDWPTTAPGVLGPATLDAEIYNPILEFLSNHAPHEMGELIDGMAASNIRLAQVSQAVSILQGMGVIQPAADMHDIERAKAASLALNRVLAERAFSTDSMAYLSSPVIGAAISASRVQQLFWLSRQAGCVTPDALADFAWSGLRGVHQVLLKNGEPLRTEDDNLSELRDQAVAWTSNVLPVWIKLGVA